MHAEEVRAKEVYTEEVTTAQMPDSIVNSLRTNARLTGLLWLMPEEELQAAAETMFPRDFEAGQDVIIEGEIGTRFYIIESGCFQVFVSSDDAAAPVMVEQLREGASFGELALLYSKPRSATVTAVQPGRLWVMEQQAFQAAVMKGWNQPVSPTFLQFLRGIPLFECLDNDALLRVGRALIPRWFGNGDDLIQEGKVEELFYILRTGEAEALVDGQVVERYESPGTVIGSSSLLNDYRKPQEMTVRSRSDVTVAFWMSRLTFDNIMGAKKKRALEKLKESSEQSCVCM